MKPFSLLAAVLVLGVTLFAADAEAKRLGGSKSFGMQRSTAVDKTPSAPTTAAAPAAGAAGAAAAPSRSWMGPVAGLAAGLGLAALASHLGFGEAFANMLMIALLVMAVIAVIGFVMRKRAVAQGGGMAYAGAGAAAGQAAMRNPSVQPLQRQATAPAAGGSLIGSAIGAGTAQTARWPADFDAEGFARHAKVNFIRLQAANDEGNLDDLRQFTTPEMFAELQMDLAERGGTAQHTEVVRLDAEVLEVVEEGNRYIVSVHFHGLIREDRQDAEAFSEVWHLVKPREGGGWVIAGIQQAQ